MEVLMTLGCHHQKGKNKYGVQHVYKFTEEKEGKMTPGVGRETLPFMMPNVSDAERVVLLSSRESRFEVSIKCNSDVNFPINRRDVLIRPKRLINSSVMSTLCDIAIGGAAETPGNATL
jgi:hypothetical protein